MPRCPAGVSARRYPVEGHTVIATEEVEENVLSDVSSRIEQREEGNRVGEEEEHEKQREEDKEKKKWTIYSQQFEVKYLLTFTINIDFLNKYVGQPRL